MSPRSHLRWSTGAVSLPPQAVPSRRNRESKVSTNTPLSDLSYESYHYHFRHLEQVLCTRLDQIEQLVRLLQRNQASESLEIYCPDHASNISQPDTFMTQDEAFASPRPTALVALDKPARSEMLLLRREWKSREAEGVDEPVSVSASRRIRKAQTCDDITPPTPWWILQPSSRVRLVWDIIMALIIGHDMAVVPVALAFETGENPVSQALFWPFLIYWTVDIPISFITGFFWHGQANASPYQIASHYMRTWFLIDIFILSASWTEVFFDHVSDNNGTNLVRAGKGLRGMRILRAARVLRLAKVQRLTKEFEDRIASEYIRICLQVMKLVLTILWLNHFIACAWWSVGTSSADQQLTWTTQYKDSPVQTQYFTSLHWSLTQFTPASMEVSAGTMSERVFSVVVLVFAMVTFSSFVSSITQASTKLRHLTDCRDLNFSLLRRYLHLHEVPMDLSIRILHCVDYRLSKQKTEIQESQVDFLELLSKPLQMELSRHLYAPILTRHPFFLRYLLVDSDSMRRICVEAVTELALFSQDPLFTEGSTCEDMYFVLSGHFLYSSRKPHARDVAKQQALVRSPTLNSFTWAEDSLGEGRWCCEVCLWIPWVHKGTMIASSHSEALALRWASFLDITSDFPLVYRLTQRYANLFYDGMKELMFDLDTPLTDLSAFSEETLIDFVERAYLKRWTTAAGKAADREATTLTIPAASPAVAQRQVVQLESATI